MIRMLLKRKLLLNCCVPKLSVFLRRTRFIVYFARDEFRVQSLCYFLSKFKGRYTYQSKLKPLLKELPNPKLGVDHLGKPLLGAILFGEHGFEFGYRVHLFLFG